MSLHREFWAILIGAALVVAALLYPRKPEVDPFAEPFGETWR